MGEFASDEQRAAYIAGLIEEKAGYEVRVHVEPALKASIAAVEAELARLGHGAAAPKARAEKRSTKKG